MAIGPVEYIIIEFTGNRFAEDIAPALAALVDSNLVRILNAELLSKDGDGVVSHEEYDAGDAGKGFGFAALEGTSGGFFSDEDLATAADVLAPDSSALLLVWEDVWATDFAVAVRGANGAIVTGGRVPPEMVEQAIRAQDG